MGCIGAGAHLICRSQLTGASLAHIAGADDDLELAAECLDVIAVVL
jgi:hypothetical protein